MGWIRSLLRLFFRRSSKLSMEGYQVYRPSKRVLYCYFDGKKDVSADPLCLYKKFIASSKDLIPIMVEANILASQGQMYERLITKLREMFKLDQFEDGGLTDIEVLQTFDNFLEFCGAKKKEAQQIQETLEKEIGPTKVQPDQIPPSTQQGEPTPEPIPPKPSSTQPSRETLTNNENHRPRTTVTIEAPRSDLENGDVIMEMHDLPEGEI